jgi:hypothetical protein
MRDEILIYSAGHVIPQTTLNPILGRQDKATTGPVHGTMSQCHHPHHPRWYILWFLPLFQRHREVQVINAEVEATARRFPLLLYIPFPFLQFISLLRDG